jgi:hypothetical protein
MKITYEKRYDETASDNFTLYGGTSYGLTNVFYEYYSVLKALAREHRAKEEVIQKIKEYKPTAKSKLRIGYSENEVEFFKPNRYIFPEFYIIFKDKNNDLQ